MNISNPWWPRIFGPKAQQRKHQKMEQLYRKKILQANLRYCKEGLWTGAWQTIFIVHRLNTREESRCGRERMCKADLLPWFADTWGEWGLGAPNLQVVEAGPRRSRTWMCGKKHWKTWLVRKNLTNWNIEQQCHTYVLRLSCSSAVRKHVMIGNPIDQHTTADSTSKWKLDFGHKDSHEFIRAYDLQ